MKLSMIAAVSENGVIGSGLDIPWKVKGEQLLFKALTFNQWCIVGRKTFESMGNLPNRNYAVISRSRVFSDASNVMYFKTVEAAVEFLGFVCDHVCVIGGSEIYHQLIDKVDTLHISMIHRWVEGNVYFPDIPEFFQLGFEQPFISNINYTYRVYSKVYGTETSGNDRHKALREVQDRH